MEDVADHLRQNDICVVLTGGSCVSIYTNNRYLSYVLDFIEEGRSTRKKIGACLREIGFQGKDQYFTHTDTRFYVEFPSGPLAIGDEPVREIPRQEFVTGSLRLLSPAYTLIEKYFISANRDIYLVQVKAVRARYAATGAAAGCN